MDPTREALKAAVLGAQQIQAPTGNPLGASNAAEVANFYNIDHQTAASVIAGQASSVYDDVNLRKKAEAEAAAARAAAEAEKRKADLTDPSKYRQVAKDDGGYDFFDPDGNQIDIAELSKRTGTKPVDWIKDSENPIDIQYREDWANLQDFMSAVTSGDREKANAYNVPEQYKSTGGLNKLIEEFKNTYQRYYVPRSKNKDAWGMRPGAARVQPLGEQEEGL